jgi:hypothetical protein
MHFRWSAEARFACAAPLDNAGSGRGTFMTADPAMRALSRR